VKLTTKHKLALTPVFVFAGMQSAAAQNDTSTTDGSDVIFEEIIVTAQKRSQSIYDVPTAISAFSSDKLESQGIQGLIDVGKFVPNLNVTSFGAGQVTSVNPFIRGIGLQDHLITTDPGVGVYLDGVYLGRQLGQNLSLGGIERLEVLRGPQGTLYGRNSIGGAINIITKKPGEETESRLALEVGSRGRLTGSYFGNTKLSDTFGVAGSVSYTQRDGIGNFTNIDTSTEVGEFENVAGRLSLSWTPTDALSISLIADANDADSGLGPYTTFIDLLPNGAVAQSGLSDADVGPNRFDNATGQADLVDNGNSSSGVALTVDYELSDQLNLKLLASTRTSDYTAGLDDDSTAVNFLAFPEQGEADQESFELQVNGDYGSWDFVSGIYYFQEDGFNDQPLTIFNTGAGSFFLEQDVESTAVYANVGFNVSEKLRLAGGLRYTDDDKAGAVTINGFINGTAEESFSELSWDFSATYELNNGMTAYGTIASGFQSGQFPPRPFCLFGDFFGAGGGTALPANNCFNGDIDNITALNFEAGIKGQLTDYLQMSLALFNTEYSDLPYQVSTTAGAGFNTVNIIVDQTSRGVEWESSLSLGDDFFINSSLGYLDVDVDDENPFVVAPLSPELTFSISPEYTVDVSNGGSVTFRADLSYRDDMFGEPSSDPGRFTRIDSRTVINADINYTSPSDNWTLGLYARNLSDERYENARLNTGDYILAILSNDPSEFGLRYSVNF